MFPFIVGDISNTNSQAMDQLPYFCDSVYTHMAWVLHLPSPPAFKITNSSPSQFQCHSRPPSFLCVFQDQFSLGVHTPVIPGTSKGHETQLLQWLSQTVTTIQHSGTFVTFSTRRSAVRWYEKRHWLYKLENPSSSPETNSRRREVSPKSCPPTFTLSVLCACVYAHT